MSSPPHQAFFQVAVVLIPGLLFGGALTAERARNSRRRVRSDFEVGGVLTLVLFAVAGEIVAIRGAVDAETGQQSMRFVALVVVLGTMLIGVRTAASWLGDIRRLPRRALAVGGLGLFCCVVVAQALVTSSVTRADRQTEVEQTGRDVIRFAQEANRADLAAEAGRASLAALVEERLRGVVASRKRRVMAAVDAFAFDAMQASSAEPVDASSAIDRIDAATDRARTAISAALRGTSELLLVNAVERQSALEAARAVTRENLASAQRRLRSACGSRCS